MLPDRPPRGDRRACRRQSSPTPPASSPRSSKRSGGRGFYLGPVDPQWAQSTPPSRPSRAQYRRVPIHPRSPATHRHSLQSFRTEGCGYSRSWPWRSGIRRLLGHDVKVVSPVPVVRKSRRSDRMVAVRAAGELPSVMAARPGVEPPGGRSVWIHVGTRSRPWPLVRFLGPVPGPSSWAWHCKPHPGVPNPVPGVPTRLRPGGRDFRRQKKT